MIAERVLGIGGVFFRSAKPGGLAAWYEQHLGIDIPADFTGTTFSAIDGDQTVWALFPADTNYFGAGERQLMVNYRVRDLAAMLEQLRLAGVSVDDRIEDGPNGRFGWASDPEGNRFELWEPPR